MADQVAQVFDFLTSRGFSRAQAAGIIGNLQHESGLNPTVRPGDNGTAFGIAQWRGPRWQALQNFTAARGMDPHSLGGQLEFLDHELRTTEKPVLDRLMTAQDPQSATAAFLGFERPQGYSPNDPAASHGWSNRLGLAMKFAGVDSPPVTSAPAESAQQAQGGAVQPDIAAVFAAMPSMQQRTETERPMTMPKRRLDTQRLFADLAPQPILG